MPVASPPLRGGAVAVRDGRVAEVGVASDIRERHPDLPERRLGASVIAPGFVDAHCHLEWSLTVPRPSSDFATWMADFLALRRQMRPEDHLTAAQVGVLERLAAGTTALADNGPTGVGVHAMAERGLRGVVHLETFGDPETDAEAQEHAFGVAGEIAGLEGARVEVGLSPHAPYTVGPGLWRALAAQPDLTRRRWSTHLAESPAERRWLERGDGPLGEAYASLGVVPARWPLDSGSVITALDDEGALRAEMIAAHCVHLVDGEAELLARRRVSVAHCPSSNRQLLCGRLPIARLIEAGVLVALGTDSPASGGPFDLRQEARTCRELHAASGEAPTAEALVRMLTEGGAAAIGLEGESGRLEPGLAADAVALTLSGDDPWEAVLDAEADVQVVWIGGEEAWSRESRPPMEDALATAARDARLRLCYQSPRAS